MKTLLNSPYRPAIVMALALIPLSLIIHGRPFWVENSILIAIFSLMALSVGISYGRGGILSIATAAFAAMGAFGSAVLTTRFGLSPYLGLVVAILVPIIIAYPIARAITRLAHMPLSIATFLISGVFEIFIREAGDITGGFIGISAIPRLSIAPFPFAMHLLAWGVVVVALVIYVNLMESAWGRAVNTARHDALRATADGVSVSHLLAQTFAISASLAGVAGWLYAHHLTYIGPDSLTVHTSITILLMAVVGGARTYLGPIVGAALLLLITLFLPAAESQGMFFGAVLVLVLLVAPGGLLGTDWRAMLRRSSVRPGAKVAPAVEVKP